MSKIITTHLTINREMAMRQCREDVGPEHAGPVVIIVETEPCNRTGRCLGGGPRGGYHRLSAARRRADWIDL